MDETVKHLLLNLAYNLAKNAGIGRKQMFAFWWLTSNSLRFNELWTIHHTVSQLIYWYIEQPENIQKEISEFDSKEKVK